MDIVLEDYQEKYRDQLVRHFENFQDYLIDLDPIKRLRRQPGYGENVLKGNLEDVKEKEGAFILAIADGKVIGFVVGVILKHTESELFGANPEIMGRVEELYVDPEYRAQGIGTKLMNKIEEYFKEKHCQHVWVEVFKPNERTHKLYEKLGYKDRNIDMIKSLSVVSKT